MKNGPSQGKANQRVKADWEVREKRFEKKMRERAAGAAKQAELQNANKEKA